MYGNIGGHMLHVYFCFSKNVRRYRSPSVEKIFEATGEILAKSDSFVDILFVQPAATTSAQRLPRDGLSFVLGWGWQSALALGLGVAVGGRVVRRERTSRNMHM